MDKECYSCKFDISRSKITCASHLKGPGRINSMNISIKLKLEQWAINPVVLFIILGTDPELV